MTSCNCAGRGCTGACEERLPSLLESLKAIQPWMVLGKPNPHFKVVSDYLKKEIARMEARPSENEIEIRKIADAVIERE